MEDNNLLKDVEVSLCSVCEEPLTAFGSKELKDGILCRNCAKELSEWLTDEMIWTERYSRFLMSRTNRTLDADAH